MSALNGPLRTVLAIVLLIVALELRCLPPLSIILQINRGGQFYWLKKPENPEKTTDLPQVTDTLYHSSKATISNTIARTVLSGPFKADIADPILFRLPCDTQKTFT
jgi:hypothetical protein